MEAWLKGVSMVGLPRNLILVPAAGKPSSKTTEHTHREQSGAARGPKDCRVQNRTTQLLTRTSACFPFSLQQKREESLWSSLCLNPMRCKARKPPPVCQLRGLYVGSRSLCLSKLCIICFVLMSQEGFLLKGRLS